MAIGKFLKKALVGAVTAPVQSAVETVQNIKDGKPLKALESGLGLTSLMAGSLDMAAGGVTAATTPDLVDPDAPPTAVAATLTPDANALAAQREEEARKRRQRTPGRNQYVLNSTSTVPSLVGGGAGNGLF